MNAGILSVGRYLPERVLTNFDLEKMVDTSDEWIRTRTGIEERRIAGDDIDSSHMATFAAEEAIKNAGLTATDIDMIIVATITPDYGFPSVASMVQHNIGARQIPAMDVSAACAGFIYAAVTAKQFIETGAAKYVLVIGVEKLSKITDYTDRNTCVLFGDGAGAIIMGPVGENKGILSFELGTDGSGRKHLFQNGDYIYMNGREVFKFAVRQMGESSLNVIEKANLKKEDIDYFIPHQANYRIMESARQRLEVPVEKMAYTINKYGNNSSASIPIALYEALQEGKIKDNDVIVMVGFGGGLSWGALTLRWGQ